MSDQARELAPRGDRATGSTEGTRGDQRRTALLAALDQHLKESTLDSINVADISKRAGVTRSAFYFYFENKAEAVAALAQDIYAGAFAASEALTGDGAAEERLQVMVRGLFDTVDRNEHMFRAVLDARASSAAVREMWDRDRESFIPFVAEMIDTERLAGRAPEGTDARALASVLLELNDRMLERLALGSGGDPMGREQAIEAVVTVWLRTIYGRIPS